MTAAFNLPEFLSNLLHVDANTQVGLTAILLFAQMLTTAPSTAALKQMHACLPASNRLDTDSYSRYQDCFIQYFLPAGEVRPLTTQAAATQAGVAMAQLAGERFSLKHLCKHLLTRHLSNTQVAAADSELSGESIKEKPLHIELNRRPSILLTVREHGEQIPVSVQLRYQPTAQILHVALFLIMKEIHPEAARRLGYAFSEHGWSRGCVVDGSVYNQRILAVEFNRTVTIDSEEYPLVDSLERHIHAYRVKQTEEDDFTRVLAGILGNLGLGISR